MGFQFILPTRILFGQGSINQLGLAIKETGIKPLIITGINSFRNTGLQDRVKTILENENIEFVIFDRVKPEPDTEIVDEGIKVFKENRCDTVVAIGGGSVIDVGKSIAGLAPVIGDNKTAEYLEVDGIKKIVSPGICFISVPTISGTGAEITNNAVLINQKTKIKRSIRSKYLFPNTAIIDPELTLKVSPELTSISGIDCFTHLIEGFISLNANPMTDIFAIEGINLVYKSLIRAIKDGNNIDVRTDIALASLYGGIVIVNSGLGLVHGLASVIGPKYNISHGLSCALVLSKVLEYNFEVLDNSKKEILKHIFDTDDIIWGINNFIAQLGLDLNIKRFKMTEKDILEIVDKTLTSSSAKKNPRKISRSELIKILGKEL